MSHLNYKAISGNTFYARWSYNQYCQHVYGVRFSHISVFGQVLLSQMESIADTYRALLLETTIADFRCFVMERYLLQQLP